MWNGFKKYFAWVFFVFSVITTFSASYMVAVGVMPIVFLGLSVNVFGLVINAILIGCSIALGFFYWWKWK